MLSEVSKALFEEQIRGFTPKLAKTRNWVFHAIEYPIIDCEFAGDGWPGLRIHMDCTNWDERPPSIKLLTPAGELLTENMVPRGTGVFNHSQHPTTQNPFICMQGSYEYHTHPSHLKDHWEPLRSLSGYTLGEILSQIWNAWKKDRKKC